MRIIYASGSYVAGGFLAAIAALCQERKLNHLKRNEFLMSLTHFVRDRDVIFSIIENGFVYFHNETKVLLPIISAALKLPEDSIEPTIGGMVCFTDIPIEKSGHIRERFGDYGISIFRGWAKFKDAKRVKYLPSTGPEYERLIKKFSEVYIKPAENLPLIHKMQFAKAGFMKSFFPNHEHTQILRDLEWMQTDSNQVESEWRIRSPEDNFDKSAIFTDMEKKDAIEHIISMRNNYFESSGFPPQMIAEIKNSLTLQLDNNAVVNFVCPIDDMETFSSKLAETRFASKPILPVTPVYED